MKGYQLTFFTSQDRRHRGHPLGEWLLQFATRHGAVGSTLIGAAEGFDHHGRFHSAGFVDLADRPLEVTMSVDEEACRRLLEALAEEEVDLAYVKIPVEFGRIGKGAGEEGRITPG